MPRDYQYAEGGGNLPPYRESFLENIVGVSWGGAAGGLGGTFVSGDVCCYLRFVRIPHAKASYVWFPLTSLAFGDDGGCESSSYGNRIFLMGGHSAEGAVIMRSTEGMFWKLSFFSEDFGGVDGLVFDNGAFYATNGEAVIASGNGLEWRSSTTKFTDHCKGPLKGVPDGIYGFDEKRGVLIYPGDEGAIAIVGDEEFDIDVGLTSVRCIAFAGNIWAAGGAGALAIDGEYAGTTSATTLSFDGGATWFASTWGDMGMTGDFEVATMSGAPISEIPGGGLGYPGQNIQIPKPPGQIIPPSELEESRVAALLTENPYQVPVLALLENGGKQYASRSKQSGRGPMAAAISAPRRARPRLRNPFWSIR